MENITNKDNPKFLFKDKVIITVTSFETAKGEPPGYLCGGDIYVYPDGYIEIINVSERLEKLHISEIISAVFNVGNFNPEFNKDVSVTTRKKKIRMSFQSAEIKSEFRKVIESLADNKS